MANFFKNAGKKGSAVWQTLYTAPAATTSMAQNIHVANTSDQSITISVRWVDTSAAVNYMIASSFDLPPNSSINVIDKALILETGDKIEIMSSVAEAADFTMALLEIQ